MKNLNLLKRLSLGLTLVITLSSCGTAKNVAGEIESYKDSIKAEMTSSDDIEETKEVIEEVEAAEVKEETTEADSSSSESENKNTDYLAAADVTQEKDSEKEEAETHEEESIDEADEQPNNEEKSVLENETEAFNEATEEKESLEETSINNYKAEHTEKPVAETSVEKEIKQEEKSAEISHYIVNYGGIHKEYMANEEGLKSAITDGLAEIDSLDFLDGSQKQYAKANLAGQKSTEKAIYFMANVRANQLDQKIVDEAKPEITEAYKRAKVVKVIDAETLEIEIDGTKTLVKLNGIIAPKLASETNKAEYYANESYEFTKQSLEGKNIFLETATMTNDDTGHTLANIWLAKAENPEKPSYEEVKKQSFNGIMIAAGYANPTTNNSKTTYNEYFESMQKEAIKANIGMWY